MNVENYKNVIIGSGEGGKYLAWHLAQSGQQTVVVERRWTGGSCPHVSLTQANAGAASRAANGQAARPDQAFAECEAEAVITAYGQAPSSALLHSRSPENGKIMMVREFVEPLTSE